MSFYIKLVHCINNKEISSNKSDPYNNSKLKEKIKKNSTSRLKKKKGNGEAGGCTLLIHQHKETTTTKRTYIAYKKSVYARDCLVVIVNARPPQPPNPAAAAATAVEPLYEDRRWGGGEARQIKFASLCSGLVILILT